MRLQRKGGILLSGTLMQRSCATSQRALIIEVMTSPSRLSSESVTFQKRGYFREILAWVKAIPASFTTFNRYAFIAVCAMLGSVLDGVTTVTAVESGMFREANPALLFLSENLAPLWVVMLVVTLFTVALFSTLASRPVGLLTVVAWSALLLAATLKLGVGAWNLINLIMVGAL